MHTLIEIVYIQEVPIIDPRLPGILLSYDRGFPKFHLKRKFLIPKKRDQMPEARH